MAMKKFFLLLMAAALVLPLSARQKGPSQLTVISYNIRTGKADDGTNSWQFRYPTSAMMIDDQKPDVFGVQEAYDYQVQYLTEYPGYYKSVGVGRDDGKSKGEHMSIFYNKKTVKMLKWGTFWLSETPDKPSKGWDAEYNRTATWALLKDKKSGRKYFLVNTHLDNSGAQARAEGLSLILSKIAQMIDEDPSFRDTIESIRTRIREG